MTFFIFGNGKWSKNHQRILKDKGVRFKAFDIETTPAEAIKEDGPPEAVLVTASTVNHWPLSEFFLSRSIPVFCEKPICLESWQIKSLDKYVSKGSLFMAGHQLVFDPTINAIAQAENAIFFSSKRTGAIPRSEGAIMSLAIHDISIASHLFGYEQNPTIIATGNQHTAQLNITWPSGKIADIYVQSIAQVQLRHAVIVTKDSKITYITPDCWNRTDLLEHELMHFIECVFLGRHPSRNNLQQALEATRITIAARDSINLKEKGGF